ncbi:MAG: AAA family ATPase [Candidatus Aenigmarchaeota archaeon]|nr:AAA family ATPase [Candidatus Aenigmarchaeota archaeon]
MVVIAVTGKRGSGKDTFAGYLKDNYGFIILGFSKDGIFPLVEERGLEITRENLINVAMETRKEKGNDIFARILCEKISDGNYCVTGMRFKEELDCMKNKFGDDFILVSIICNAKKRYERVINRGDKGESGMSFEEFMKVEENVTEKAIDGIINSADYFIDNNTSIDNFHENAETFYREL